MKKTAIIKNKNSAICKYIAFIIILLLLYSCSDVKTKENLIFIDEFLIVIDLEGYSIEEAKSDFYPLQMGLKDSMVIFCDWEHSPHFHVYKIPEFNYMGSFGQRGRGPSEIQDPVFWDQTENNEHFKIWIYQMNLRKLTLINVFEALTKPDYLPDKDITMPPEILDAVNIIAVNDELYIGCGIEAEGEFFIYNTVNEELKWKEFHTYYDKKFASVLKNNHDMMHVFKRGIIKIKPDRTKFVKALIYAPVIDIYNTDGVHEFSIMLKDYDIPDSETDFYDGSASVYYENVFLTDNYIYALNRNCDIQQYSINDCNDAEIHVFNWNGESVCNYRLNEGVGFLAPFVVDEVNRRIYTVNPENDEGFFRVFELESEVSLEL